MAIFDIVLFSILFVAMLFGVSFDRRGHDEPKWVILGLGVIGIGVAYWNHWTFFGVWRWLVSGIYWEPLAVYVGIGLIYSCIEFFFAVRRAARQYADAWAKETSKKAADFVRYSGHNNRLVGLELVDGNPSPKVDRAELADCIGAWTLLWPPYLVSLVLGDLLIEIWNAVSDLFIAISARFVRFTFRNTFR